MYERDDVFEIRFASGSSTAAGNPSPPATSDIANLSAVMRNNTVIIETVKYNGPRFTSEPAGRGTLPR